MGRNRTRSHHKRALSPEVSPDFKLRYRKEKMPRFVLPPDAPPEVVALARKQQQYEDAHPEVLALMRRSRQMSNDIMREQTRQILAAAATGRAFDVEAFYESCRARYPGVHFGEDMPAR